MSDPTPFEAALERHRPPAGQTESQLAAEIARISGDPSGSPLESYMPDEDVELCRDFLRMAGQQGLKGTVLKLETTDHVLTRDEAKDGSAAVDNMRKTVTNWGLSRFRGNYTISKPLDRVEKEQARRAWRTVWTGEGFMIGRTSYRSIGRQAIGLQDTYLCTDGFLRCSREGEGFQGITRSAGVGRLPSGLHLDAGAWEYDSEYASTSFRSRPLDGILVGLFRRKSPN